jgi:ankyrin repeat protein
MAFSSSVRFQASLHRYRKGPAVELDAQGPYNGLTHLIDAIWHGHLQAVRALIEAGAPLDIRTHAGLTPKEMALLYGYEEIAALARGRPGCGHRASGLGACGRTWFLD